MCAPTKETFKTPLFRWHLHFIVIYVDSYKGRRLPGWHRGKESALQSRRCKRWGFDPWVARIPWTRKWEPAPVSLLRKFHGPRSLVVCSSWGCKELDTHTHTHTPHLAVGVLHWYFSSVSANPYCNRFRWSHLWKRFAFKHACSNCPFI